MFRGPYQTLPYFEGNHYCYYLHVRDTLRFYFRLVNYLEFSHFDVWAYRLFLICHDGYNWTAPKWCICLYFFDTLAISCISLRMVIPISSFLILI